MAKNAPSLRDEIHADMAEAQQIVVPESALYAVQRPVDVAYLRQEIVDWWSKADFWQHHYAMLGRRPIKGAQSWQMDAEGTRWWTEDTFRRAELYWVSPEMSELIAKMYPSIPDCVAQPPCERGFVVFGKAIPGTDAANGGPIHTTAFMWGDVNTMLGDCYAIETYCHRDALYSFLHISEKERERFAQEAMPLKLHPTGGSEWPKGTMISDFSVLGRETADREESMMEDRRLLACFWALCSQKITLEERWEPDRRTARQFTRRQQNAIPPWVRVIRLREPTTRSRGADQGEVEWSHRWIVGEHWRNQWYPSTGQHTPKLIHAYQKGPADKPLLLRDTVKALVR
jgi:hypothetical protein